MKQTTLDLNGPILSFTQHPQSTTSCSGGSATFVAIATATFPTQTPVNPATNTGTLSYSWYAGQNKLNDGTYLGATISGSQTNTLTISNPVSPTIKNLDIYAGVDYVPSAYSTPQGSTVTVGTARSTGNAINEILFSDSATLTVYPEINITSQPEDTTVDDETTATFSVSAELTDTTQGSLSYQWFLNDSPLTNGTTSNGIVVSGATSANLSIFYPFVGVYDIKVRITHPVSCDSPLDSDVAVFGVVPASLNITTEVITSSSSIATIQTQDLVINNQLTLLAQNYTNPSTYISLFAPGRDIDVEMEIYGGKGNNSGAYSGGEGGYSKIRFTMNKNEEYVIAGLNSIDNNPFVYRKSTLIAVCGKGGDAANGGDGGDGGGIGIAGKSGRGSSGGSGGNNVSAGSLSSAGIFGSTSNFNPISPDTRASQPNGGRTIPCTKGNYWSSQGFTPCQDIGTSRFFYGSTQIVNTSSIDRGFKQGYEIRQTGGKGAAATTGRRYISQTCTRNVPQTCYRTVSSSVSKSTTFTHVFDNTPGVYSTTSLTASGDAMTASAFGETPPNTRGYTVNLSGLGLNSTGYTYSVSNTSQAAAGNFPGITFSASTKTNYQLQLYFTNNSNSDSTFARSFTVSVSGTANVQQSYDCSYTETYDCSYYQTYTISGGGNGGSGATGGQGGGSSSGGGGGSGYTDGSVTVVESTSGGNNGNAKIILRAVES